MSGSRGPQFFSINDPVRLVDPNAVSQVREKEVFNPATPPLSKAALDYLIPLRVMGADGKTLDTISKPLR